MKYHLILRPRAEKELKKLPKPLFIKFVKEIQLLSVNPFLGKKLEGDYENQWSIKIWPYRVIYEIYKKQLIVLIIRIRHRRDSYRK